METHMQSLMFLLFHTCCLSQSRQSLKSCQNPRAGFQASSLYDKPRSYEGIRSLRSFRDRTCRPASRSAVSVRQCSQTALPRLHIPSPCTTLYLFQLSIIIGISIRFYVYLVKHNDIGMSDFL